MSVIYILISLSILIAIVFFAAFILAVKNGQFDDSHTPAIRILFDGESKKKETNKHNNSLNK
ncbi:cbb3-type cytochrome oxidase assembly protein CcoS [Galbibacter sp.]|jgi:cbb3-type cytochrome oxidase maturation protein|uniref:cbb3-type cytochrome oxidase assembly protein CcoS n=1 Tax=Galbibacter sp. TaxID=2918471 RepID=UPI003A8F5790